jgi:hypothetical protein
VRPSAFAVLMLITVQLLCSVGWGGRKGRKLAPAGAAAAAACPDEPEQCHWLGHSFQLMAAAFFDDEEAGDLALHLGRNQDRAGFRQGLHPCGGVRHVAVDLAR